MDDRHIPNEKNGSSGELSHTPIDVEDSTKLDRTTQGSKDNGATHQFNEQTHYMDTKRIILVCRTFVKRASLMYNRCSWLALLWTS